MKTFLYPYVLNKSDETPIPKVRQGIQARNVINTNLLFKLLKARHIEATQEHCRTESLEVFAYPETVLEYASGMGEGIAIK